MVPSVAAVEKVVFGTTGSGSGSGVDWSCARVSPVCCCWICVLMSTGGGGVTTRGAGGCAGGSINSDTTAGGAEVS